MSDTIPAGHIALPTSSIPPTSLMVVTLVSDDARLTLQRPDGTTITSSDTSVANGIGFFGVPGDGFEGYSIANPATGTWTFRVDATAAGARQLHGCAVSYATATTASLTTRSSVISPGDSIRVRSDVQVAGVRQTGLTWSCRVIGPNNAASSLTLYDDGAHGDSLANDGIYGNATAAGAGLEMYRIVA